MIIGRCKVCRQSVCMRRIVEWYALFDVDEETEELIPHEHEGVHIWQYIYPSEDPLMKKKKPVFGRSMPKHFAPARRKR